LTSWRSSAASRTPRFRLVAAISITRSDSSLVTRAARDLATVELLRNLRARVEVGALALVLAHVGAQRLSGLLHLLVGAVELGMLGQRVGLVVIRSKASAR